MKTKTIHPHDGIEVFSDPTKCGITLSFSSTDKNICDFIKRAKHEYVCILFRDIIHRVNFVPMKCQQCKTEFNKPTP